MRFNPEQLNITRQNLLDKIAEYFLRKDDIEALYIQGSVAARTTDEFSDIDFRVVINVDRCEQVASERFEAPKLWGDWVYNEWTDKFWVCVSHFKPFNKVDVIYLKPEHIQPSPWFLLPTQVVYDREDLVQQTIQASEGMKFVLELGEIDRLISKGLAYAEEVYRRVMRDELFYAQSLLDAFRGLLIQLDDYSRNSPFASSASLSHFEQRGSRTLIENLKLSYTALERQPMLYTLSKLLEAYQNQIIKLHEKLPLQREQTLDLDWISTIRSLCEDPAV